LTKKKRTFAAFFKIGRYVGKFSTYQVDFKNWAPAEMRRYEYLLDSRFFADIEGDEVQKGKVKVELTVERKPTFFQLEFHVDGVVMVACDRCLDDMEIAIESDNRLIVKIGQAYSEESDEVLVIAEDESSLNLAWFLYEFVALAVPMRHVHAPGKCNKAMSAKLKKHSAKHRGDETDSYAEEETSEPDSSEDVDNQATDPRWEALKDFNPEMN
jgi:uncharacterized metal-binding protein YceD (DUF177 family)